MTCPFCLMFVVECPLSIISYMSFLWILILMARALITHMEMKIVMETHLLDHHYLKVQESLGLLVSVGTIGTGWDGCGSDTYFSGFCFPQGFCSGFQFVFSNCLILGRQTALLHREAVRSCKHELLIKCRLSRITLFTEPLIGDVESLRFLHKLFFIPVLGITCIISFSLNIFSHLQFVFNRIFIWQSRYS